MHGLGHANPENEITNRFLEELDIGTNDEWILERTGIRSRRTVMPLDYIRETRNAEPRAALEAATMSGPEMGRRAAERAIARAGIDVRDIGMVISGCSAPDTAAPAEACNIARLLELEVPSFDVNSACTSFFAGLNLLSMLRPETLPPYALLVGGRASSGEAFRKTLQGLESDTSFVDLTTLLGNVAGHDGELPQPSAETEKKSRKKKAVGFGRGRGS